MAKYYFTFVVTILLSLSDQSSADIINVAKSFAILMDGFLSYIKDIIAYQLGEVSDTTPSQMQEYDFVVIGAGSAGAALAARLSENPNIKVLLIEAGGHEFKLMRIPVLAIILMLFPLTNWNYYAEPSNEYCLGIENRQCYMPVGKVMGGSSSINFMLAIRGHKNNFNEWAEITGDQRWSYENVLPYFKKMEKFQAELVDIDAKYHNFDGPVSIVNPAYLSPLSHAFTNAGKELGLYPGDYNGANQTGLHYTQTNHENGERVTTNDAYIRPAKNRPNLHVSMHSHVTKVLINPLTKIAYGVEFVKQKILLKQKIRVRASKEVIVSAGTLSTPKILMHSGIGPAQHLQDFNISVVKDSPVGKNLMDHITFVGMSFIVNDTAENANRNIFSNRTNNKFIQYFNTNNRKGPLTSDTIEGMGFLNVDDVSNEEAITNMELSFGNTHFGYKPISYHSFKITDKYWKEYFSYNENKPGYLIWPTLLQPKSRGEILLRSKNPLDSPKIYPNYLSHPEDIRIILKGIRLAIDVGKSKAMQRYNSTLYDRPVPGCEQHEWNSDNYWICAFRTLTITYWHFGGTCRMGPKEDNSSVVDSELKVKGIQNLRVVDGSIMPTLPSAHTNLPIIMIGELAADIVKDYWKIQV